MQPESKFESDVTVTAAELCKITGLGKTQINNLSSDGVFIRKERGRYWALWSIHNYIGKLQETSTSTAKSGTRTEVQNELDEQRAENQRIKNAILKKEYAKVSLIRDILSSTFGRARQILSNQKPKLRQKYGDKVPGAVLTDLEKDLEVIADQFSSIPLEIEDYDEDK